MNKHYESLVIKLKELFQMDQADLDFGIYKIMNAKHDEIETFLKDDLLPTVRDTLNKAGKSQDVQKELEDAIKNAQELGVDPDTVPKVQKLKELVGNGSDSESHEEEIFSSLITFFSRYYDGGDFLSLRRYKKETFSPLPMNGEESKFHWANADQYYIKSAENFSNYAFLVEEGQQKHRIRFELGDATTEQNNVKSVAGKNRQFILDSNKPLSERKGDLGTELVLHFQYQSDKKKRKQKDINLATVKAISSLDSSNPKVKGIENWESWQAKLLAAMPTDKNPNRTTLERYLTDYTAKNTFDYFIHKDLESFLSKELDFFIKNELFRSEDTIPDEIEDLEKQIIINEAILKKTVAFKQIAKKVIAFLAQVENFQKRVWLKKKFVIESNYCVTLDRIPAELYSSIADNEQQFNEWEELFSISELEGYSKPLTNDFLVANPYLIVDTAFFGQSFKEKLLQSFENIDNQIDGVICHSDNYQALRLLKARYSDEVKCVYIDPPYNTDVSSIPYKNNYRHSSWGTLMRDRLKELSNFMSDDSAIFVSIDKAERQMLEHNLDSVFGQENKVEELIWIQNTNDGRSPTYSTNHEYVEVYAKDKPSVEADFSMFREPKPGLEEVMNLVRELNTSYPSPTEIENELAKLYSEHKKSYKLEVKNSGLDWEVEKRNDPWKGIYAYQGAEYRDKNGKYVAFERAKAIGAKIWIYTESDWTIMSSDSKQSSTTKDPNHKNFRYYEPIHPQTGKPCKLSSRGWKGTQFIDLDYPNRNSFESLQNDHRIAWGKDEQKVPRQKRFLHEVETNVCKSVFTDYSDGEKETTALFGKSGLFLAPKHTNFVRRFITQATNSESYVLDCFGGSGSSADAVIRQNREDQGSRKYILAEMGHHFDTILKPRILKSVYSSEWKAGKPITRDGISHCLKYLRLESYEDALDNIELEQSPQQADLLEKAPQIREDYLLNYMLDIEARGSLMNSDYFTKPFDIKMKLTRHEQSFTQNLDVIETFNNLLGLRVETMRRESGIFEVVGKDSNGELVLILWRDLTETDNDALDNWFKQQDHAKRNLNIARVYVNGDNNVANLRESEDKWTVHLIEDAFYALMFNDKDE